MAIKTKDKPSGSLRTRYEDDLYTWVQEQVALLRAGLLSELDALNVAEELSDVGRSERRTLESSIAVLTQHLLKWDYQPKRRSLSWQATINEQRRGVARVLSDNPGLKSKLAAAMTEGYASGRDRAVAATKLPYETFPEICPYTFDEMISREIVYEKTTARKRQKL